MRGIILISGNGSNLKAIINNSHNINLDISCVISNKANALGLIYAEKANIPSFIIESSKFLSKKDFEDKIIKIIDKQQPQIIILAGFMYIFTKSFVNKYLGQIINIHPSILPKFKGLNTHQKVIETGEKEHGATVHFVTKELDGGAIIAKSYIKVLATDDSNSLQKKVIAKEHKLYSKVINWFTSNRLKFKMGQAILDGKTL